jgi:L-threonylcarbamoyladenylate synthase
MAELIHADSSEVVERFAAVLEAGGTVVFPTDTVYAIGALPGRAEAVARIFDLKRRPLGMHLTVLVADEAQVASVSADDRPRPRALMRRFWPGQVTLVLPVARREVAHLGADDGTIGVRCPDHELVRAVAARAGPIATTSANLHRSPTPATAAAVVEQLPDIDLVVDGGELARGMPSTVVDVTGAEPVVLRNGVIELDRIMKAWASTSG